MLDSARCSEWWAWEQALLFGDMCVQCVLVTVTSPIPLSPSPHFYQTPSSSQEVPLLFSHFFPLSLFLLLSLPGVLAGAQGITAGGGSRGQWLGQVQEKAFYSTPPHHPTLPFFLPPLGRVSRSEEAIDVPCRADHSTVTYPHHLDSVRVSALTTANRSVFNQVRARD